MGIFGEIITTEVVLDLDLQTPSSAATIDIAIIPKHDTVVKFTSSHDATINISSGTPDFGDVISFIIQNDSGSARTITFGTKFKPSATIVGTINKTSTITFRSDGSDYYEISRTLLL